MIQFFRNLRVKTKVFLGFTSVLFLLCAYSYYSISSLIKIQNQTRFLNETSIRAIMGSLNIQISVNQVQQWLTDISATRGLNGMDDGFTEAEEWSRRFDTEVEILRDIFRNNKEATEELDEIKTSFGKYYTMGKEMAKAYISGGPSSGNKIMEEFDSYASDINERVENIVKRNTHELDSTIISLESEVKKTIQVCLLLTFLAIVIGLVVSFLISNGISVPISAVSAEMKRIANGSLTGGPLHIASEDEIGELNASLNQMKSGLHQIVLKILSVSSKISAISGSLSGLSDELTKGAEEQAERSSVISVASQEMVVTTDNIAHNAETVSKSASETNNIAIQGGKLMEENIRSMTSIMDTEKETRDIVQHLSDRSGEIGKIVGVISDIAEQTNLLALNAAIEAARAGEYGRGFAVVSEEVRKLADRTTHATEEIEEMVKTIQDEIRRVLVSMDNGDEIIKNGVQLATKVEDSLTITIRKMSELNEMISQVSRATNEQAVSSDQISKDIESIVLITEKNSGSSQEISRLSIQIDSLASDLKEITSAFEVTPDTGGHIR